MRFAVHSIVLSLALLIAPTVLLAAVSEFTITTFISTDTQAPTTPTLLSVIPVASTQITISWSAATDDVAVVGYRLFRNSIQHATTTLLTYNDTGLAASTTYTYTVDAVDGVGNISSTSLALATTTLPLPPVSTSTATSSASQSSATKVGTTLVDLKITTDTKRANFTWQTSGPTQYSLVWGRTTAYELGSVSSITYTKDHVTILDSLEPGTKYYYQLMGTDVRGVTTILSTGSFVTMQNASADLLPNVRGFKAAVSENDVALSWQNAFTNPNYYVRIVRSYLFYPNSIQSGAIVYEGRAQAFIDRDALATRSPQYYTIFVLDGTGAVSGGSVASAYRATVGVSDTPSTTIPTSTIPTDIGDDTILRAADITIIQKAQDQLFNGEIELSAGVGYVISIPYTAVPKNLKSIIVTVQNPSNQKEVSAYLLKLNQTGDAYTAIIPGSTVVGTAQIMVEVFDYEQATVRRISTTITYIYDAPLVPFFPDRLLVYLRYIFYGLLLFSFLWLLIFWRRRRNKLPPEDNSHDR